LDIQPTCLAIADISGYTRFIRDRSTSLLHAEQIITELLDAVVDQTRHPLILNKFEGDAALLYARCGEDQMQAAADVLSQANAMFTAFRTRQNQLIAAGDGGCGCDACTGIGQLRLKVMLHLGDVLIKQIRQFEELAGEPVIILHRLLKNSIQANEYLLMTQDFHTASGAQDGELREEACDGFALQAIRVIYPEAPAPRIACHEPGTKPLAHARSYVLSLRSHLNRLTHPKRRFSHLEAL
jgi:hypothetical protein